MKVFDFSSEGAERRKAQRAATRTASARPRFSTVAEDGKCPKCGSTSLTPKRSVAGKLGLGVFAPKSQVRCDGCGTTYTRS